MGGRRPKGLGRQIRFVFEGSGAQSAIKSPGRGNAPPATPSRELWTNMDGRPRSSIHDAGPIFCGKKQRTAIHSTISMGRSGGGSTIITVLRVGAGPPASFVYTQSQDLRSAADTLVTVPSSHYY